MDRRVATAGEWLSLAGWREDAGYRVIHFTPWARARAMEHWIDRSGIAHRPMPKLGSTAEEIAERKREALGWGLGTGTVRDIVQTYRRARHRGESELIAFDPGRQRSEGSRPASGKDRRRADRMGNRASPGLALQAPARHSLALAP